MKSPLLKFKLANVMPMAIACAAIGLISLLTVGEEESGALGVVRRLEWLTYDWRARQAAANPIDNVATNSGFIFISDDTIEALKNGTLDYRVGLYWPRYVYGRLVRELAAQGAEAIAFDVLFPDERIDHPKVAEGGVWQTSDQNFANQLARAGNVVLAAERGVVPDTLFRTNAWAIGDISAHKEADGVLRRTKAFEMYYLWHPLIRRASVIEGFDLRAARIEPDRLVFSVPGGGERFVELDRDGNFDRVKLYEELGGQKITGIVRPFQKPYEALRVWDMGLTIAARHLHLDLANAVVLPDKIILRGRGTTRVIPVDHEGRFLIDWTITVQDRRLTRESMESLLLQEQSRRLIPNTSGLTNRWKDKLVFIGSTASAGNDLTDLGATPLEKETYLTSRFWNTANSLLTGRFIRRTPIAAEIVLFCALGLPAGWITQRLRPLWAVVLVFGTASVYSSASLNLYISSRIWLPMVSPLGALFLSHFSVMAYRAFSEQNERRRIKNVFAKIVSPNVVNELLKAEKLSLIGARRKVSVLFADVRGFTELTERSQMEAEEYVRQRRMNDEEAEAYFDLQSQQLLHTVNLYLGLIADIVKKHDGTLDKYIGDCVMAFWGAPAPNEQHALACVRAAIESQRAIQALNQQREAENIQRGVENVHRLECGQEPLPLLKVLSMGTGISTGVVTVGLMGSDAHIYNFTVFGREVNVASRLEGCSGKGRIIIGAGTYLELLHDAPELASTCIELPAVTVRGISAPINLFEVPWRSESDSTAVTSGDTAISAFPERDAA